MTSPVPVTPTVAHRLAAWRHARRYAVPPAMIAAATERRLAGDWRGACAAARFRVALDLDDVRAAHGAELAGRVADDLAHLAPDLARWHLPLAPTGGAGRLEPGVVVELAAYGGGLSLQLRLPLHRESLQRPDLTLGRLPAKLRHVDSWAGARHLWDVRASGALLDRLAAGGDRLPFHTRDGRRLDAHELPDDAPRDGDPVRLTEWVMLLQDAGRPQEAWKAAGVEGSLKLPTSMAGLQYWERVDFAYEERHGMLVALVRHLRALEPSDHYRLEPVDGYRGDHLLLSTTRNRIKLRLVTYRDRKKKRETLVPRAVWQRFPDLELLRLGHLTPSQLHPLVRASLFPEMPDPGPAGPPGAATDALPDAVRVRCRGVWHRVGWRDGQIDAFDHDPAEARRERALRALGGAVPGCFAATDAWRGTTGRLPRPLRELRRHALGLILAGQRDAFVDLLDRGLDPLGVVDRRGRRALHLLAHLDDATLVPRLVAAGLDPNDPSSTGRPPLLDVIFDGGSAELVEALLDAGADPTAHDGYGSSGLHLMRSPDAARIVPLLVAAGLDVDADNVLHQAPLTSIALAQAPPEAFAALLAAGADAPGTARPYRRTLVDHIKDRDDLPFVRAALAGAGRA